MTTAKLAKEQNLILVKNLTWGYDGVPLFKKFNFSLHRNEFAVIMGTSGSGKTTLAKLITAHLSPPLKTVYYSSDDISKISDTELQKFRRNLGMVFQRDYLIDTLSIKDNILYPLHLYGYSLDEAMQKYREILRYLNIRHLPEKKSSELSTGELQKIFIARALIHSPEFILIDDSLTNLDKKSKQQILDVLVRYHADGHTLLLITHDENILTYLQEKTTISLTKLAKEKHIV